MSKYATKLSTVTPRLPTWLWRDRIPEHSFTTLGGPAGLGKSTLTHQLAAALTRGKPLAGIATLPEPGSVLFISTEEQKESLTYPRMKVLGADLDRIHVWNLDEHDAIIDPDDGASKMIEECISELRPKLVIIDPIVDCLGGKVNNNDMKDVSGVLRSLYVLAERWETTFIGVVHTNRRAGGNAAERVNGSYAWISKPRSVLMMGLEPEAKPDDSRRLLAQIKSNLGKRQKTLKFSIGETKIDLAEETFTVAHIKSWNGYSDVEGEALYEPPGGDEKATPRSEVKDWLSTLLDGNDVAAAAVYEQGAALGFAQKTIRRAADDLGVVKEKVGYDDGSRWVWKSLTTPGTKNPGHLAATSA